jgi:Flp pilus assembly protein TadD
MMRHVQAILLAGVMLLVSPSTGQAAQADGADPLWLVVPFENASGEPRLYWLAEGSAVILADALQAAGVPAITRDDRVRAFERLRVPLVTALSHATVIRLAQIVEAAQVIVGSFELRDDVLTVRARAIRLDTGRLAPEIVEAGSLADLVEIHARVVRRLVPDREIDVAGLEEALPPPEALEQYVKGILTESASARMAFLNQALRLSPGYQEVRLALWGAHTDLGEHQAALNVVRFVPSAHRLARQAQFLAGVSLLHLGQFQQAYDTFLGLHQQAPDASLVNNVGVVQLRRRGGTDGRPASAYFSEAVEADDTDPDLLFNLGYALWREGRMEDAIHWLREVVRRRPADDAAHFVLGLALEATGSVGEAEREKDLARRLSSRLAEWEAAQTDGRPGVAPDGLERVKVEFDVPASLRVEQVMVATEQQDQRQLVSRHLEAARRLIDAERDAEAIAELRRAVYLSPYESDAHLLLGRAYLRAGRLQDAVDALTIAVWSRDAVPARLALAEALIATGDFDAARAEIDDVRGREPGNGEADRLLDLLEPR